MNSERHTDYLMMMIFLLGSICLTRWLYLEIPDGMPEQYFQASPEDWTPPLQ